VKILRTKYQLRFFLTPGLEATARNYSNETTTSVTKFQFIKHYNINRLLSNGQSYFIAVKLLSFFPNTGTACSPYVTNVYSCKTTWPMEKTSAGYVWVIPRLHDPCKRPANVEQLACVFWIHLLEVCWKFSGCLLDRVNGV